eukprot:1291295-Pyramimonas_sp.AAC.1
MLLDGPRPRKKRTRPSDARTTLVTPESAGGPLSALGARASRLHPVEVETLEAICPAGGTPCE